MCACQCGAPQNPTQNVIFFMFFTFEKPALIISGILELLEEDKYDEIIRKYIRQDQKILSLKLNNTQFTIFLLAVVEKREILVTKLIKNAMKPSHLLVQRDIYGNTALHLAVVCQSYEIVKLLLEYGSITNLENKVFFIMKQKKRIMKSQLILQKQ